MTACLRSVVIMRSFIILISDINQWSTSKNNEIEVSKLFILWSVTMKIHISYFTSTGNTLWIAKTMQALFENEGHTVRLFEAIKDPAAIMEGKRDVSGNNPVSRILGILQRAGEPLMEKVMRNKLCVNKDACTGCSLCVKMCPAGTITMNEVKEIMFGPDCIYCLKCYNLCPANAVCFTMKSKDPVKYYRHKGPTPDIKPVLYR